MRNSLRPVPNHPFPQKQDNNKTTSRSSLIVKSPVSLLAQNRPSTLTGFISLQTCFSLFIWEWFQKAPASFAKYNVNLLKLHQRALAGPVEWGCKFLYEDVLRDYPVPQ